MLVYLDTQESVLLRSKDKSFHVLFHILRQYDSHNDVWYGDAINKEIISQKLKIAYPTLNKHISSLKQRGLICPIARGEYKLNPNIFST